MHHWKANHLHLGVLPPRQLVAHPAPSAHGRQPKDVGSNDGRASAASSFIELQAFRWGLCRGLHACHVQVQLAPSAVAADGSGAAAATGVPGGNRARVRDGVALFKDVRIVAERPGTFTLAAKTASRKARAPQHCGPGLEYRVGQQ